MKTRGVVWTLVTILVTAVVVFLLATRRRDRGPDLDGVRRQAVTVEGRLSSLEQKLAQTRSQLPPGQDPVQFAPVEQSIMDSRNALAEVHIEVEAGKLSGAMDKLGAARSSYSSAVTRFRKLTRPPRR